MLAVDVEDHEFCEDCGDELFSDGEFCFICDDGPFCVCCMGDHENHAHAPKCRACGKELEIDPPCPICHREFCEGCISTHVELCRQNEDIHMGLQPTLYHFMFQDGLI